MESRSAPERSAALPNAFAGFSGRAALSFEPGCQIELPPFDFGAHLVRA